MMKRRIHTLPMYLISLLLYVLFGMCISYYISLVYQGRIWRFDRQLNILTGEAQVKRVLYELSRSFLFCYLIFPVLIHMSELNGNKNKYWFFASYIFLTNIQSTLFLTHLLFLVFRILGDEEKVVWCFCWDKQSSWSSDIIEGSFSNC